MPTYIQPSFAKGEIAPELYGRVDTALYSIALRTARNVIIGTSGGASNRAGTTYIGPSKNHTDDPRIIPFRFNTTDKYFLEFGDQYMRVIRNKAYVLETGVAITGATQANPVVVTANSHGFSDGDEVSIADVAGMTEINSRRFLVANKTANTFELQDQVTGNNVDGTAFTAYSSGGTVSRVFEIATPYAIADTIQLKYQQTQDVMTLTHRNYEPRELTRTDHDAWTLTVPEFTPSADFPLNVSVTVDTIGSETYRYKVTALFENPTEESLPGTVATKAITNITQANPAVVTSTSHGFNNGEEVHIKDIVGMTELNNRRFIVANKTANTFELQDEDSTGYTAYSSGGSAGLTTFEVTNGAVTVDNTISWDAVSGASRYTVYREKNGLSSFLGETELTTFKDDNIDPDVSVSPPKFRNPFFGAGNYPAAVGYYEQRRVFGGSSNKPDTSFFSQTGNHSNFTNSFPLQADDAITATLSSGEVNEIRHYIPGTDLIIMTSGSEWRINSGQDTGFSANTLRQKPQTFEGVSHHRPIVVGDVLLFVTENNSEVRNLGYSLEKDRYRGTDLALTAKHLLEGRTVVDTAFANSPDPVKYLVLDDGTMLTMTYNPSQEMIAWTRWDTLGKFKRVAVLRNEASSTEDGVCVVVQRTINENTVRFTEIFHSRIFDTPEDCFFVDAGLSLDNPIAITNITGANPIIITTDGPHGLENGDEVDLSDIVVATGFDSQFNETEINDILNGRRFTVQNKTSTTFEITPPS